MLTLIAPPAAEPVSLDEVKLHMRVDADDEDLSIEGYLRTARQKLDGQFGLLGRCLIAQSWRLTLDSFPSEIVLPLPPCISIDRIAYLNADGDEVDLAASAYRVTGIGGLHGARVRVAKGSAWPRTVETESVFVEFTAGFGPDPDDVPEPLRTAIKTHAAHLFEHRESVILASGFIAETPHGYDDMIRDYRMLEF